MNLGTPKIDSGTPKIDFVTSKLILGNNIIVSN
jgi:hypothetical protein